MRKKRIVFGLLVVVVATVLTLSSQWSVGEGVGAQGKVTVGITKRPTTEWPFPLPPRTRWWMYLPSIARKAVQ